MGEPIHLHGQDGQLLTVYGWAVARNYIAAGGWSLQPYEVLVAAAEMEPVQVTADGDGGTVEAGAATVLAAQKVMVTKRKPRGGL